MTATIDVLGEEIHNAEEAQEIVDAYHDTLDAIAEHELDANVSVKPTAVGLKLGYDVGSANVESLVRHAAETGNFVRIDMEDSTTTDDTLRIYRELRDAGLDNVGVVLQARLRRTLDDIAALADLQPNVRICKGIYLEPEEIAFTDFEEIRESYVRRLEALVETASYVGIATHDEFLIYRVGSGSRGNGTSSRCCSACARRWGASSSRKASGSASTCRSAGTGTSTRCAGCRRTRASPGTSRPTRSGACSPATVPRAKA